MDINKYIIQFLIKNKYCSLPGLGSFDLKKVSAAIKKENGEIVPSKFEITYSMLGCIDDTFASYMASEENVSISNSSNNIKQYCISAKEELAREGKFTIDHLGFLTMQNNKITFVQTDELDMGKWALPLPDIDTNLKSSTNKKLDFSYPAAQSAYVGKSKSINKFVIPILILLAVIIFAFVAYKYYKNNTDISSSDMNSTNIATQNTQENVADTNASTPIIADSSTTKPLQTEASIPNNNGNNPLYKIAVFSTSVQATADAKAKKWKNYGNLTDVQLMGDQFVVTMIASHPTNDTTLLIDSLRRFFNPKGNVYILK